MSIRKIGYVLAIIGISGILISILIDTLGFGDGGIQAAQILGIEFGLMLALLGLGLVFTNQKQGSNIASITKFKQFSIFSLPGFTWVLISFLIVYVAFFLGPLFLNSKLHMVYFNRYIPNTSPIGSDLRAVVKYVEDWLISGLSPYEDGYIAYPPLALILFAPLLLIGFPAYFHFITFSTLLSYILVTLILPIAFTRGKDKSTLLLLFIIGLFSYGLQFEIERGQFNLIAFALCLSAIYIFHKYPTMRYFSYALFVLSVQLKIYPALFIFMFIDDWRNWKLVFRRIFGLGFLNFLLLFILGSKTFNEFIGATTQQQLRLTPWNGSSIRSFVFVLSRTGFGVFSENVITKVSENPRSIEMIFLAIFGSCFVLLIAYTIVNNMKGFNPYLFLACTVGVLIIPTISNDYKLPLLVAPVSILFSHWPDMDTIAKKIVSVTTLIVVSGAFWSTLYPFKYKPEILLNSMPILIVILLSVTILTLVAPRQGSGKSIEL